MYPYQFQQPQFSQPQFSQPQFSAQQNMLPAQQIPQANGKQSIDALKMAPNSSVLIADTTAPIIWRCVSDSLGNVTAEAFDVTPHKEEKPLDNASVMAILTEMNQRITKLEEGTKHEQSNSKWDDQVFPDKEHDRNV